ncbi:MAG: hypothetical protein WBP03_01365 [Candidatus Saccharimonadales bacterium]
MTRSTRKTSLHVKPGVLSTKVRLTGAGGGPDVSAEVLWKSREISSGTVASCGPWTEVMPAFNDPNAIVQLAHALGAEAITFQSPNWDSVQPDWADGLRVYRDQESTQPIGRASAWRHMKPREIGVLACDLVGHEGGGLSKAA